MEFLYDIFDVSVPQGLIESMSTPFGKRKQTNFASRGKAINIYIYSNFFPENKKKRLGDNKYIDKKKVKLKESHA